MIHRINGLHGALAAALLVLSSGVPALAGGPPCVPPVLTGPKAVDSAEAYSLSWTNVLGGQGSTADFYQVERATDSAFTHVLDRFRTTRPTHTLPPPPAGTTALYHRVVVVGGCVPASPGSLSSNVFATSVRSDCAFPEAPEGLSASPAEPPALSTYVVSWDTGGAGRPGPGGGAKGITFRLRRIAPGHEVKESVSETGSVSFQDPPGVYAYQVRAEARCGAIGVWSPEKTVVVGAAPVSALALVSEPKPMAAIAGPGGTAPTAVFSVRNGGTTSLSVTTSASELLVAAPEAFRLGPGQVQKVTVTATTATPMLAPHHGAVVLGSEAGLLRVPVDVTVAATPASSPVTWSASDAELDDEGTPVRRTLVNAGQTRAAIVGSVSEGFLSVDSGDGLAWDRPLAPGERRILRISVDRERRRARFGTETAVVSVTTAGFPGAPAKLLVVDDGPKPVVATGVRAPTDVARTRILYASMPNAKDILGVGRFTSDLWLTNLDAVSPIDVTIWATPLAASGALVASSHVDLRLAAGETRRYRNVIGKVFGYDGACELEVRSPATTLSATALVANTPFATAGDAAGGAPRLASLAEPLAVPIAGQYGFEMRPTAPGEGVKATDPTFVLSGLAHDARRRTNVILTETTGHATTVLVSLFDNLAPVERNGVPVQIAITVPPLSTVQINDAELFDGTISDELYALVYFQSGAPDVDSGEVRGAVVPFATVIDSGTEDASLRVGTSVKSLTPQPEANTPALARLGAAAGSQTTSLPFEGGPAPLLFPAAHIRGAALSDGTTPYWKTRVSFTNVSETERRQLQIRFLDQSGNAGSGGGGFGIGLSPKGVFVLDDIVSRFLVNPSTSSAYGAMVIHNEKSGDEWSSTWQDIDVQTETYTADPREPARGDFKTGMEGFSYRHGYSSFQSNLGTVQIEGAETSSRYRTNLILGEVGGAPCTVAVSAYSSGSFVPLATATVAIPAFGYVSKELFKDVLGLDRSELTDVRLVVRQVDGDGVFMAFASKINLATGDPANIFLRPASAGTGR